MVLFLAVVALLPAGPAATLPEAPATVTYVYWTEVNGGTIRRGNADGSGSAQTCVSNQQDPRGLVIVQSLGKMYWIEREAGRLRRANLDCPATGIETIGPTLISGDRVAMDVDGGHIYWTENQNANGTANRIRRANLDGSGAETILSGRNQPLGIAVAGGHIYWTEFGDDSIWRASLTGSNPIELAQLNDNMNPLEMAVDVVGNRMYWASGTLGAIYSATLSGSGVGVWQSVSNPRSLAIDVDGQYLYWSNWNPPEIRRMKLDKSNNQQINDGDDVDQPLGIALYQDENPCYILTRSHSGQGSDPVVTPTFSAGCGTGQYKAGEFISLTAAPAGGWRVSGWSGTKNDASTGLTNSVTMPATAHAVSVAYEPQCYTLTRIHIGQGNAPVASPAASAGCGTGQYKAGEFISLTAVPAGGWRVSGWSGTKNDASTGLTNSITMPAAAHAVTVFYQITSQANFYMPVVLYMEPPPPLCFTGPNEVEDNDLGSTANGPLCRNRTYTGRINDNYDYFMFDAAAGPILIDIPPTANEGLQLALYYQEASGAAVIGDPEQSDGLRIVLPNAPTGRYYIRLFTPQPDPGGTQTYSMHVQFP